MKISLGMWLTIAGAFLAIAGQIKVYFENQESELKNQKLVKRIDNQSKENNALLKKNRSLTKEIKKITLNQTELLNDEAFFRNFDFSYAIKDFPEHSAYIFRQTKSGRVFSKSISKDSKIYEDYSAKIIFKDNKAWTSIKYKNARPSAITKENTVVSPIRIDDEYLDKMQIIRSAMIFSKNGDFRSYGYVQGNHKGDICKFFKLLSNDNNGLTFIVGRSVCE